MILSPDDISRLKKLTSDHVSNRGVMISFLRNGVPLPLQKVVLSDVYHNITGAFLENTFGQEYKTRMHVYGDSNLNIHVGDTFVYKDVFYKINAVIQGTDIRTSAFGEIWQ